MKKKKKKKEAMPNKLEKAWVAYVIDTSIGHRLMMVGMRHPDKANKLQTIVVTALNKLYAERDQHDMNTAEDFIIAAQNLCIEVCALFIRTNLKVCLINGMPEMNIMPPPKRFDPKIVN